MTTERNATIGHVLPFALWVGAIFLVQSLEQVSGYSRLWLPLSYALKTVVCAGLFLWFKPWRYYPALTKEQIPITLVAGLGVATLWILPETPWVHRGAPAFVEFYHRWCILMPGTLPDYFDPQRFPALPPNHPSLAYSPAEAGWFLTVMKIIGSAGVIAIIEEFFFRGFFYRWLRQTKFLALSLAFDAQSFWIVAGVFALEHDRWLGGLMAGIVYGLLAVYKGIWSAALAHVVTNLVLALYVVLSGQYGFW